MHKISLAKMAIVFTLGITQAISAATDVKLQLTSGFYKQVNIIRDPKITGRDWFLSVDVDALAALRRRADLSVGALKVYTMKYSDFTAILEATNPGDIPIAPEVGTLTLEMLVREQGKHPVTKSVPWKNQVGKTYSDIYTTLELSVVWNDPSGAKRPLFVFSPEQTVLQGHLNFTLETLFRAARVSLGLPQVPDETTAPLSTAGLKRAIADAERDGFIDEKESRAIFAVAERDGIDVAKATLVAELYARVPPVLAAPRGMSRVANLVLKEFIRRHANLLGTKIGGGDLFDFDETVLNGLPLPPATTAKAHAIEFFVDMPPDVMTAEIALGVVGDDVKVYGGQGGNRIDISNKYFRVELASDIPLVEGGEYTRGIGMTVNSWAIRQTDWAGARFKIHRLRVDAAGEIKELVVTWLNHQRGGFAKDIGICPGYLDYRRP